MRTAQSLGRRYAEASPSAFPTPHLRASGHTAPDGRRRLSIIMPAHNEDRTIGAVVDEVLSLEMGFDTELIVVDDGSTDRTPLILGQFDDDRLIVHRHPDNLGKGAAVLSGAALATGSHLVVFDADGEYVASDLALMFAPIVRGRADVVFGTRMFGMNTVYQSFRYAIGNRVTTLAANVLFDSCLTDLHTCLKMMPITVFRELDLDQKGFALDSEITAELLRRGHRPFEVPVSYHSRSHVEGKKLTWRDGVECLLVLAKVRLRGKPRTKIARRGPSPILLGGDHEVDFRTPAPVSAIEIDLLVDHADGAVVGRDSALGATRPDPPSPPTRRAAPSGRPSFFILAPRASGGGLLARLRKAGRSVVVAGEDPAKGGRVAADGEVAFTTFASDGRQPGGQILGPGVLLGGPERHPLSLRRIENEISIPEHPGPGRDQLPDDDVLLEAEELVRLALDGRLGEHPGRLLEGRGREPALRGEGGLGDAHQLGAALGGALALGDQLPVDLGVGAGIDTLAGQERVTRLARPRAPGAASAARSARCACHGSRRPGRDTPAAPR